MRPSQIPPPAKGDHEDVHWALSTAHSLQAAGEHDEALRWVRRAVAAAVACDDDMRAIELGRFAAELEESLAGAATLRGEESQDDGLDPATYDDTVSTAPDRKTPRARDTSPDTTTLVDEEVTLVPFTMKAAGLDAAEMMRVRRLASRTMKVEDIPRPPSDVPPTQAQPEPRPMPSRLEPTAEMSTTRHSAPGAPQPAGPSPGAPPRLGFADDEPTIASRPALSGHDAPAASSTTMPAMTRWRVALLATADDDPPRVIYLGPGVEAPAGAAVAFLVPCSAEDARAVAILLKGRR
jgi:hypothetical protein